MEIMFAESTIRKAALKAMEIHFNSQDDNGRYKVSAMDACIMACEQHGLPKTLAPLISFAMYWSNDLSIWAEGDYDKDVEESNTASLYGKLSPIK